MLHQLGWRSLLQLRADIHLVFLYKCANGLVAVGLISNQGPNPTDQALTPHEQQILQSFLPHTLFQWNHLPEFVAMSPSLDTFKQRVSTIIHLNPPKCTHYYFSGWIDRQKTLDLFDGVLMDILTKDPTPKLISLAERESSYLEEDKLKNVFSFSPTGGVI